MKKIILTLICIISFITSGYANGMGTYAISAVTGSNNPIFRNIEDVVLLSEKLYIKLLSSKHEVTVNYILWNRSDNDYIDLDYAFPVDYIHGQERYQVENKESFRWDDNNISDINFIQDGKNLSFHSANKSEILKDEFPKMGWNDKITPNARRWFYTKVSLEKHSYTELTVTYKLSNLWLESGDSPCIWEYTNAHTSFSYDFSPASHWGDGFIRDLYVEINVQDLAMSGNIKNMNDIQITGLDFKQTGNYFIYQSGNFDLKNALPLEISYPSELELIDILKNHHIRNNLYSLQSSPTHTNYPVTNLTDLNLETAWVPTDSKGGWIEYSFNKPQSVVGFILVNGYHKNKETFIRNNRVKELKAAWKYPDEDEWHEHIFEGSIYTPGINNLPYETLYWKNLINNNNVFLGQFCDLMWKNIERIRFTIEDIHPGSQHNDTCISELILLK